MDAITEKNAKNIPYHLQYLQRDPLRLESLGQLILVPKGHEIGKFDEIPDYCYLVKSGRIACYEVSCAGEQRIYNIMLPGSMFLEECILYHSPCPVIFKAIEESQLVQIDRCDLVRAFKRDIDVVMDICESLAIKFLSAMEQLRLGPHQSAAWKLCKLLLIYGDQYGVPYKGKLLIKEKISQQMIADILGMNRVTVTRKLKELKNLGLIETVNGCYCIRSVEQMEHHMVTMETMD